MGIFIKKKIGYWHRLNERKLQKLRNQKISKSQENIFIKNLNKIGYSKNLVKKNNHYKKILATAFQRRFRPKLVNGIIDKECFIISKNLI